jgi:flagellar assembly protein FliH
LSTDTFSRPVVEAVVFPSIDLDGEAEGHVRGHAAGYAAGLRRAAADVAAREERRAAEHAAAVRTEQARTDRALAVLDAAARALATRTTPVLAEVDAQLVAAALVLAEAVVGSELSDAPRAARAALTRALSGPDASDVVEVRLHPRDLALVADVTDGAGAPTVTLVADPSLVPGDAVAVYPDGELDARVGTALERARSVVAEARP